MPFISKKHFTAEKLTLPIKTGYSMCNSFNNLTIKSGLLDTAEYIIVGTLTPKSGRDNGYFYCSASQNQRQFKIIDEWENDSKSLDNERQKLIKNPKDNKIIKEIENILLERKLAFVDVIKTAIASNTNPSDNEIVDYVLDYEIFVNILNSNRKITFVANSKNAFTALNFILEKIKKSSTVVFIPQTPRTIKGGLKEIKDRYSKLV